MKKSIAVDFDGVIHNYSQGWQNGMLYDVPVDRVAETLGKLKRKGYNIIIFTTRLNPKFDIINKGVRNVRKDIEDWLRKYDIPYDELTNNKPAAIAYIDDRAIRFTNWKDILNYF